MKFGSKGGQAGQAGVNAQAGRGHTTGDKGNSVGGRAGDAPAPDDSGAGGDLTEQGGQNFDDSGGNSGGNDGTPTGLGGTTASGGTSTGTGGTSAANGAACTTPNTCQSGRCVDGVCCNGPCDDTCQACSFALTGAADGICSSVKKGTDPHDTCATAATSTCGLSGLCGSNGVCALYDTSITCVAASCTSGVGKNAQMCDGAGACKAAVSTPCSPYICGSGACLSTCNSNTQCASGQVCVGGACKAPAALLGACDENADCAAGSCIGGICALTILSVQVYGSAVPGGGSHGGITGWFKTDSAGKGGVQQGTFNTQFLWSSIDTVTQFPTPIAPNSYLVLGGANEGSDPVTRNFQFNLSDGSSITKAVSVASSVNILWDPFAGELYTMFQWTGAGINASPKTY